MDPHAATPWPRVFRAWLLIVSIGAATTVGLSFSGSDESTWAEATPAGLTLEITGADIDGLLVPPAGPETRWTLINVWATWCGPCREEIPALNRFVKDHGKSVRVIGVSVDESPDEVRLFRQTMPMNYAVIMSTVVKGLPKPKVVPTSFLLNPDGTVLRMLEGKLMARHLTDLELRLSK